jgi:hypothetical protein
VQHHVGAGPPGRSCPRRAAHRARRARGLRVGRHRVAVRGFSQVGDVVRRRRGRVGCRCSSAGPDRFDPGPAGKVPGRDRTRSAPDRRRPAPRRGPAVGGGPRAGAAPRPLGGRSAGPARRCGPRGRPRHLRPGGSATAGRCGTGRPSSCRWPARQPPLGEWPHAAAGDEARGRAPDRHSAHHIQDAGIPAGFTGDDRSRAGPACPGHTVAAVRRTGRRRDVPAARMQGGSVEVLSWLVHRPTLSPPDGAGRPAGSGSPRPGPPARGAVGTGRAARCGRRASR